MPMHFKPFWAVESQNGTKWSEGRNPKNHVKTFEEFFCYLDILIPVERGEPVQLQYNEPFFLSIHILLKAYFCCAYFLTFFTRARKTLKIEQPRWNNLGICKGYKTTHCIFYPTILQKYYLHFSPEKFLVQKSWKIFSSLRFWQSFQIYCRFSRPGENLIFVAVTDFKIKIY